MMFPVKTQIPPKEWAVMLYSGYLRYLDMSSNLSLTLGCPWMTLDDLWRSQWVKLKLTGYRAYSRPRISSPCPLRYRGKDWFNCSQRADRDLGIPYGKYWINTQSILFEICSTLYIHITVTIIRNTLTLITPKPRPAKRRQFGDHNPIALNLNSKRAQRAHTHSNRVIRHSL